MLSSDLWGATFPTLLSQNLLFLSVSRNMGCFSVDVGGEEHDASFMCSVQQIHIETLQAEVFYWKELWTVFVSLAA